MSVLERPTQADHGGKPSSGLPQQQSRQSTGVSGAHWAPCGLGIIVSRSTNNNNMERSYDVERRVNDYRDRLKSHENILQCTNRNSKKFQRILNERQLKDIQ